MENHGKYGQFIYTHVGDALFVNLYAASQLDWKERGITLRQETAFPYSENSTVTIAEGKGTFNLMVRYPGWVHPGEFKVSVNGKPVDIITGPSSYVSIHRKWRCGEYPFPNALIPALSTQRTAVRCSHAWAYPSRYENRYRVDGFTHSG